MNSIYNEKIKERNYAYRFEQFIFTVLRRLGTEKSIDFYFNNDYSNYYKSKYCKGFDSYFSKSINLNKNKDITINEEYELLIEIKYKLTLKTFKNLTAMFRLIEETNKKPIKLLIITNTNMLNKEKKYYSENSNNIAIWSKADIETLKEIYSFDSNSILGTDFNLDNDALEKVNETNTKSLKSELIQLDNYFTLILGAGVSCDYEIPMWDELIKRFIIKIKKKKKLYDEEYIFSKIGKTSLIKGQFIIDNFSSKKTIDSKELDFCKELQSELYRETQFIYKPDTTMDSIVKLIERKNRNNNNMKVITYNYDDILEQSLTDKGINHYQTIYTDTKISISKMPIYHVHGYLPRTGVIDYNVSNSIVFSEYKYHKLFNDPTLWQLSCQLTRFREDLCVFIGFSIFDPSVRRLLESVVNRNPKMHHYAIFAKDKAYTRKPDDIEIVSEHFSRLGVQIIWIDELSDIPKYIDTL